MSKHIIIFTDSRKLTMYYREAMLPQLYHLTVLMLITLAKVKTQF